MSEPEIHKWPKKGVFAIQIPIYSGWLYVVLDREVAQKCNAALNIGNQDLIAGGARHVVNNKTQQSVYMLYVFDGLLSTFVHELAHVCFFITGYCGILVKEGEANEAYCYLLSDLLQKCEPLFKKLKASSL